MSLACQISLPRWYRTIYCYKTLFSEVETTSVQGAIITACTVIVVGGLVNLGIILAMAPVAVTAHTKDAMNIEAIVQVLPTEVREEVRFDEQQDRMDAIRPRRSLIAR